MEATFQTKLPYIEYLDVYAAYFSMLARRLFVDLLIHNKSQNNLKKEYMRKYGLTARQFNSLIYSIKGIGASYVELLRIRIEELEEKIAYLEQWIAKQETKLKKIKDRTEEKAIRKRKRLLFKLHQKRRRLRNLKHILAKLKKAEANKELHICFGGRDLFTKQFHLEKNGYLCHSEWRQDWKEARNNQFFVVGSKDETFGNQNCTYLPDNCLRLRVANKFAEKYGQYITFSNVTFPYGQEHLDAARQIAGRQIKSKKHPEGRLAKQFQAAISYRFIRHNNCWYLLATTERINGEITTDIKLGAIGVDLNAGFSSA